jgi:hypothetical protein
LSKLFIEVGDVSFSLRASLLDADPLAFKPNALALKLFLRLAGATLFSQRSAMRQTLL